MTKQAKNSGEFVRRGGMRHVAPSAAKAARPALRKRGLATAGIITDWPEIVGPFLAQATAPEKLLPGRPVPEGGREAGVLHLRVGSTALAPEIAHMSPQIIEKVNSYFGYRAVARLHILHAPVAALNDPATETPRRDAPEPAKEAIRIETAQIDDDALRHALQRLGESIAARKDPV